MFDWRFKFRRIRFLNGLSLIEVCLAIAILAVIFISLSGIFNQGYRFLRKTKLRNMACFLAQEKMEVFLHNSTFLLGNNSSVMNLSAPYQDFRGEINITSPASGEGSMPGVDATLARINVTIYWNGTSGEQNFSLTSLVANLPH